MEIVIDLKNYTKTDSFFNRTAARGIIRKGDKYLLIRSRYGDCKFPGGGVEEGEEYADTLIREVREETGYIVKPETIRDYGTALEKRAGETADVMIMKSYYYLCDVDENTADRDLDEYEAEYGYNVIWSNLDEAVDMNRKVTDLEKCPWVVRDTKVMEYLMENE